MYCIQYNTGVLQYIATCTLYMYIPLYNTGVLQADPGVIREHDHIYRLFCHECQRVFHDRLINKTDKKYFYDILTEMSSKHFSKVQYIHKQIHCKLL